MKKEASDYKQREIEYQWVMYWKPVFDNIYAEEYVWDDYGNLYSKTWKKILVDRVCVAYDYEWCKRVKEEEPQIDLRLEYYTDNWWYYDIWWKYHKATCLLLPTQEERVKYILDNLTEKE